MEHLSELRSRLFISLISVGAAFAITYSFRGYLISWLNRPLHGREPITFGVAEPFMTSFKVAAYAALALALPILLWQLWSFVAPAVEEGVQTTIARLVAAATLLFAAGVGFAYFVVLPAAIPFLLGFDDQYYAIAVRAREYYSFATVTIFVVGILFELPVFILALVRLGVLTSERLRRNRRTGIVACVVVAVLLPGVDPDDDDVASGSPAGALRGLDLGGRLLRETLELGACRGSLGRVTAREKRHRPGQMKGGVSCRAR